MVRDDDTDKVTNGDCFFVITLTFIGLLVFVLGLLYSYETWRMPIYRETLINELCNNNPEYDFCKVKEIIYTEKK